MGFKEENLSTEASIRMHNLWINGRCQPNFWRNVSPDPRDECGPYKPATKKVIAPKTKFIKTFSENSHDTIGIVVIDSDGNVASGTSTNGARNKIPG